MIKSVQYRGFKSLGNLSLNLSNLNVITGINGVGKSSIIQGLLLLRQSYIKDRLRNGISLDGELTGNLGSISEIENRQSGLGFIEFVLNEHVMKFSTKEKRDDTILQIDGEIDLAPLIKLPLFSSNNFQYISASRITPENQFKKDTIAIKNKQFGKYGEFSIAYIAEHGNKTFSKDQDSIYKPLINLDINEFGEPLPLENQINYWLNFVANNVRLNIIKTTTTKYELNYEFFNGVSWESFSAANSAFGLTYCLPILTSLLAASPGDLVIIENPESDLHPKAQSKLGELIARCANEGVQIILETHSDHILNGIRVAISQKPSLISYENVKVFYFYKQKNSQNTLYQEVKIESDGRMPVKKLKGEGIQGFFDQIDNDYKIIFENINSDG